MYQNTTTLILIAAIAVLIIWKQSKEGWRPFAWYGYPGETPGSVGYQARGDWCGVDPATRTMGKTQGLGKSCR